MPRLRTAHKTRPDTGPDRARSASDNAHYTYDLLISLKRLADAHHQTELAKLIEVAAAEAQAISRKQAIASD